MLVFFFNIRVIHYFTLQALAHFAGHDEIELKLLCTPTQNKNNGCWKNLQKPKIKGRN
jgi:hypothetical protein